MFSALRNSVAKLSLSVAAAFLCGNAHAADPFSLRAALDDTGQYFTAPMRWDLGDWEFLGVSAAAIGAAYHYDENVRGHFTRGSASALDGHDSNTLRDAAPTIAIVAGTGLYAAFLRDRDGYSETWSLLEAGAFSTVSGEALKYAAGRERPDVTASAGDWRRGGDSFPSVHASAAFAVGMVFAESGNDEYRWIRRIIGYGVGAGTAYIRVHDNDHWLSDTVAGAAVGIATARFVLNREDGKHHESAFQVQPTKDGWMLSYTVAVR